MLDRWVNQLWSARRSWLLVFLIPLSGLFRAVVFLRRWLYKKKFFRVHSFSVPVIVVGNITVGGAGKTPVVMALARALQARGYRPGIVSRGYGGSAIQPMRVLPHDSAARVGDEALLLAQTLQLPVVVARKRAKAVDYLLAHSDCNVVISDDGLQHYAMGRTIEIVVVHGERRFGNGFCLPAGPLREPVSRLRSVDYVLVNGDALEGEWSSKIVVSEQVFSVDGSASCDLERFKHQRVHAVAGIAHPEQFFKSLEEKNIQFVPHVFPDHHAYRRDDFCFEEDLAILMTEKDAVKCRTLALKNAWVVSITALLPEYFVNAIVEDLQGGRL